METKLLLGKVVSKYIKDELANKINSLKKDNIIPGLAALLVGNDPASEVYVRNKSKAFKNNYCYSETFSLPNDVSEKYLLYWKLEREQIKSENKIKIGNRF